MPLLRLICLLGLPLLVAAPAAAQTSPRAAMLADAGWAALEAGQARAAAEAFAEAIRLDPKNARLSFGAGIAAFLERRDADAQALLERALDLDPQFTTARAQLAHVLRRQQDFDGAITLLDRVAAERPGDAQVRDTLDRWIRERDLHSRMRMSVGNHFTVSFEGPEDAAIAERALEVLDRAFWRITDVLGAFPPRSIPVVLYTREQFRDVTRSPDWAAGAYDGIIRVPVRGALDEPGELERVLSHEFAHALIRTLATRNVPGWLNEGLATAFESEDLSWAGTRVSEAGGMLPLSRLSTGFGGMTGEGATLAYATSALAARRLLDEAGGAAVANLLRDLGEGVDFEGAFLHRIQRPFAEFQASLP